MKIIFFGLGSIGERHIKLLRKNFNHTIFVYRSTNKSKPNNLGIKELYSWQAVERLAPDLAFITNPTYLHIETAIKCAELGMNLFIEKPLCSDITGLNKLIELVKEKKLTTYVAYCMRFNPLIKHIQKYIKNKQMMHCNIIASSYLPNWRPRQDYRESYSAHKKQGGGVVLDLSHEIDYSVYLFGDIIEMKGNYGKISKLSVDTEDYADILIKCKRATINMHLNFFSRNKERKISIDFADSSYIKADFIKNNWTVCEKRNLKKYKYYLRPDQMYLSQLTYFFKNYENKRMMNNVLEAEKLLKNIISFKKQHAEKR